MKNILSLSCLAIMAMLMSLFFTTSANAFWPFDSFKSIGNVKGERTQENPATIKNSVTPSPSITPTMVHSLNKLNSSNDEYIIRTVNASKLSEERKKEFRTKLLAIRAKREELARMEKSLHDWLKLNRVEIKVETPTIKSTEKNQMSKDEKGVKTTVKEGEQNGVKK